MREVTIQFSNMNGDGIASYLVDVGDDAPFDGDADRVALSLALAEFGSKDSIRSISIQPLATKVLKP